MVTQQILTDENGNYIFDVEPGTYTLLVSKEGYYDMTVNLTVTDSDIIQDFVLTPIEEECPPCICDPCPPDKLDWWLLLIGSAIGYILTGKKDKNKRY